MVSNERIRFVRFFSYKIELHLIYFSVSKIKSNLSSPYDDAVVPGIQGHLPVLGICFLCVSVFVYMFV